MHNQIDGDDVGLSGVTICVASRIEIGSNCLIGGQFHHRRYGLPPIGPQGLVVNIGARALRESDAVIIGNDVFIGATIPISFKGTSIGFRVVIGAGSIVTGDIPSGSIYAGNPARFIRENTV